MRDALGLGATGSPRAVRKARMPSSNACASCACLGCAVARSLSGRLARQCRFLSFLHGMIDEFPHRRVGIDTLNGERSRGQEQCFRDEHLPARGVQKINDRAFAYGLGNFHAGDSLGYFTFRVLRFFSWCTSVCGISDRRPTAGCRVSAHGQSPKWEGSYGNSGSPHRSMIKSEQAPT